MRLLIITLLFSFTCQGQIINASGNYRVRAAASSFSYLLDDYPTAKQAFSLRLLNSAHSADSCVKIRESGSNTEQVIGFSGGVIDTASMKTFVGANDGFVVEWYDQSGNRYNATQTTASEQPNIITSGVINRINGNPTLLFSGVFDYFNHTIPDFTGSYSFFAVVNVSSMSGYRGIYAANNLGNNGFMALARQGGSDNWGTYGTADRPTGTNLQGAGTFLINMNGTINSTGTFYTNAASDGTYANSAGQVDHIGGIATQRMDGYISEIVLWNSSPSRTGVESNINTFYSIY